MKTFRCPLILAAALSPLSLAAADVPIGVFDGQTEVGAPKISGSATFDAATQEYTVAGSGTSDQFHFVWKKFSGDFILRARVELVAPGKDDRRRVGWMVRSSLDADAPFVSGAIQGEGPAVLQDRQTKGGAITELTGTVARADVIQLERRGNHYTFSAAKFGEPFVASELPDFDLGGDVFLGLFVSSTIPDAIRRAVFSDVRVIKPMKLKFTAYTEFIGSDLQLLDLATMKTREIYSSKVPFEAPNWTHDSAALIYNVSGRAAGWGSLQRFDLATGQPTLIEMGIADRANNNDHVLSFDGTMLGISNQGQPPRNQSAVYTVPVTGGTPKLITTKTPSYFHSWSPDGKTLLFTGGRRATGETVDKYDIYSISAEGGEETKLTSSAGKSDGPEFTPDGKYIYFNSTRLPDPTKAGTTMQLWRMQPDGSNPEPVTHDEFNNWFPHLSPDGKWIVFISFTQDVTAEDHPYYRECYLRLMATAGGPARVIAYIYGGQGTMNVPSWSPDSKQLAFVTNTDVP